MSSKYRLFSSSRTCRTSIEATSILRRVNMEAMMDRSLDQPSRTRSGRLPKLAAGPAEATLCPGSWFRNAFHACLRRESTAMGPPFQEDEMTGSTIEYGPDTDCSDYSENH